MAARTAGTGVVVALVVFVLCTIFLLIMTIVFYSREQEALAAQDEAELALREYVKPVEQSSDRFKAVLSQSGGTSAMQYLMQRNEQILQKVLGNPNADLAQLNQTLQRYGGDQNDTFRAVLDDLQNQLRQARAEAQGYQDQMQEVENELAEARAQVEEATRAGDERVDELRSLMDQFFSDVQTYAQDVSVTKQQMMQMVDNLETRFDQEIQTVERELDEARSDLAVKEQQLAQVRNVLDEYRYFEMQPEALVDGRVLENARGNEVFIDRGRRDHVVLGMTFEIYGDATQLSPDQYGNIPRGKASIQITNVGETTSTGTLTRTTPGRPVVQDDVIANAVYDPDKTFLFLIHGLFDVNQDGRPTPAETDLVKTLIRDWGGELAEGEEIRGDLDFLLLGEQPPEPPPLRSGATPEEVDVWVQQKERRDKYMRLMRDAMEANIPILNQNRFFILTGYNYQ